MVLPSEAEDIEIIASYFEVDGEADPGLQTFRRLPLARDRTGGDVPNDLNAILTLPATQQSPDRPVSRVPRIEPPQRHPSLEAVPTLVWSTDDNPARRTQAALFRAWYLRTYNQPIHVVTDPANRDITKVVIQCVAGRGRIIGTARHSCSRWCRRRLDVTDAAQRDGFGIERALKPRGPRWPWSRRKGVASIRLPLQRRLYRPFLPPRPFRAGRRPAAERSLVDRTGDGKGWALIENAQERGIERRVGIMNLGAWDMRSRRAAGSSTTRAPLRSTTRPKRSPGSRRFRT